MPQQYDLFSQQSNTAQSVSAVTQRLRKLFDTDPQLQDVWIEGEVSNFKQAASGHLYFSLKDVGAQIKCVVWRTDAERLNFLPAHGDQIIAHGRIGVYEPQGIYQLYADLLQPAGLGDLHRRFELSKAKLEAEGLFDYERKRPIPAFPRKIGIVTSPDAAAFQDVLNVLTRRYPSVEVILSPSLVQGDSAPARIIAALNLLNQQPDIDLILLVRGGGSLEDLWCFNDEALARTVAASRLPIISGVGHETDFTLSDFAADLRAPTPSAAAEIATPDRDELLADLANYEGRLHKLMLGCLAELEATLRSHARSLRLLTPQNRILSLRQYLDDQSSRLNLALRAQYRAEGQRLAALEARLHSANPQNILNRGYAIVTRAEDGQRLNSVHQATKGDKLSVRVKDGLWISTVNESQNESREDK